MQYIQFQGQNASQVPTPIAGGSNLFIDLSDFNIKAKDENGQIHGGGGDITELTYTEFVNTITTSGLTTGSFYIISNFKTCYDVPDYYVNGNPKGNGSINYREGGVEPIIVLATSVNTISSTAYQPTYPKDKIQYDWTWNSTEITGGAAYGRISERIDEYNNRTDYDHRNIRFNRYQSYNKDLKLTGTLNSYNSGTGIIIGVGTSFLSQVSQYDVLLFDFQGQKGVKVVSVDTDNQLTVVVDSSFGGSIDFNGGVIDLYKTTPTGNFDEYKEVYFGQFNSEDWNSYLTFILNGSAIHNYIGDYSKFYLQENGSNSGFLLANNVFYSDNSRNYSNTIGDRSYNNTGKYWFLRNTIAGRFYNNTTHQNGFYSNNVGEYFYDNVIKSSMYSNIISEGFYGNIIENGFYENTISFNFYNNKIYGEFNINTIGNSFHENSIYSNFNTNQISRQFISNEIYSEFSGNKTDYYFANNVIGDTGNRNNFDFLKNIIGVEFNNNIVRQNFTDNKIGNNFYSNTLNGDFRQNVINNDFTYNQNIGYDFYGNHIDNGFNNNYVIGDYFRNNQIGDTFSSNNSISFNFKNNKIGNQFENNTLGNNQYFNWDNTNIENLTARTYNTFYNSLDGYIGNLILGKELIMHDTVNDEYHKVKFTQWTQNNNGGGFSYERTKVYPTYGPTVYFTKTNYGSEVDVIVEGSFEITRSNNGGIYNAAVQGSWNNNAPQGTEWNSIYTQSSDINGSSFEYNNIDNNFKGNYILAYFALNNIGSYSAGNEFSGETTGNKMGPYTFDNNFYGDVYGNSWIGDFVGNSIGNNFTANILSNSYTNTIGENFQYNIVNTGINNIDFTLNYGNITGFTYSALGSTATDNIYTGLGGTTNGNGVNATFNIEVSGNIVIGVSGNTEGKLYMCGNTITMLGSLIGGTDSVDDVIVTVSGISTKPSVYETYNCTIFERKGGEKRLSFYDENDTLTITNTNE